MTDPHRTAADAISQVWRDILAGKHGKVTLDQRHMLYARAVLRTVAVRPWVNSTGLAGEQYAEALRLGLPVAQTRKDNA